MQSLLDDKDAESESAAKGRFAHARNAQELHLEREVFQLLESCDQVLADPEFKLPMLPSVATEIMEMLEKPDADLRRVCDVITADPALTVKVLKLANSACFGAHQGITSVPEAVTRIGMLQLRDLVVSIGLRSALFEDRRLSLVACRLWKHSVECAVVSDSLIRQSPGEPVAAYLPGLLHDIGCVPALLFIHQIAQGLENVRDAFLLSLVERTHARIGVALLQHWKLPLEVNLAMTAHQPVIRDMATVQAQVVLRHPGAASQARAKLARCLGAVILADRLLACAGFSNEDADSELLGSPLALEYGVAEADPEKFQDRFRQYVQMAPYLMDL